MFKMRCRVCGSTHTKKNGVRKGVQLYKCQDCGYQFRSGSQVSDDELWMAYQQQKQTIKELSVHFKISASTVKRRLHAIRCEEKKYNPQGGSLLACTFTQGRLRCTCQPCAIESITPMGLGHTVRLAWAIECTM